MGTPLAVVAASANPNDMKRVAETLDARLRAAPRGVRPNLCTDRGYDFPVTEDLVRASRFRPHIRARGEEVHRRRRGEPPRRWPVERTHSWLDRCRGIWVRWEKKVENSLALVHVAGARLIVLGPRAL